ncbi:uncharacterized protein LOC113493894, partial [Trichoplusia ni]|uniref:Uncharacterized protein LOC113493894 n=1 Tax=Trichoplusia ni TaxID=7111 RepID=A0A7E5VHC4_TRINI
MEHDASMDVDTFISVIHARPAIWDLHSDLYSNRNEKIKAWEEICYLFINNFKDKNRKEKSTAVIAATLQRKWKSLRDSFNREIGKQNKSGSGASGRKEYIYFKQLSFLKRLKVQFHHTLL